MDKDAQIARFWEKYIDKSKHFGIRPDIVRWYVKHAEQYIKAHRTPLKIHTAVNVDKYLQDKGINIRIKDWQYCQVIDAMRILFVDVVASQ